MRGKNIILVYVMDISDIDVMDYFSFKNKSIPEMQENCWSEMLVRPEDSRSLRRLKSNLCVINNVS